MKKYNSLIIPITLIILLFFLKWYTWSTPNRQFYIFENGDCITVWTNTRYKVGGKTYDVIVIPGLYKKHTIPQNDNFFVTCWESDLIIALYYTNLANYKDTIFIEKENCRWGQSIKILNNSTSKAPIKILPDSLYKYYWGKAGDTLSFVKLKDNVVEINIHDNYARKREEGHLTKPERVQ